MSSVDLTVVLAYFVALAALSLAVRKSRTAEDFASAGRSLPGWAVGLSIFGSYISTISFLANPGKAYLENWGALVFSLSIPLAAWIATKYFVPFYRRRGELSAYEHFEERFGSWARTYAVVCFVLVQIARMGSIVYLLGLALDSFLPIPADAIGGANSRTAWIVLLGSAMTVYTLRGGMETVVWGGVLQSAVLLAAAAACVIGALQALRWDVSGLFQEASAAGKLGLGPFREDPTLPTLLAMLFYGLVTHLDNFGIDQSYVQRYQTAESDRAAVRSVWLGALTYLPVATAFFVLGTALWVLSNREPNLWPQTAFRQPDEVLPFFVKHYLGPGVVGLVVAGFLAAAMDSNLSNLATLFLCDVYRRWLRPAAGQAESLRVLRISTVALGALGTAAALLLDRGKSVLDLWWELAGILSGGKLGLFLLGLLCRRAGTRSAAAAVISGLAAIAWMSLSPGWSERFAWARNPLHNVWTPVVGTLVVLLVGWLAAVAGADHPRKKDSVP